MTLRMVQGRLRHTEGEPAYGEAKFLPSEKKAYRQSEEGRVLVETGLLETGELFLFVCPLCGREVWSQQRLEPACSGPQQEHEHPLVEMILTDAL